MSTLPPQTKRTRVSRTPDQWRLLFDRFEQSGRTRDQFCHEQGISLSSFSRWRTKLRKQTLVESTPSESPLFTELAPAVQPEGSPVSGWDIELRLGAGVVIRLRRPC
jgi:hypothetical protein